MKDFAGKVAVVTGGASGIGEGLVAALLEEEVRVVIADIEQPVLDEALAKLEGKGEVSGIVTDVARPESVEACAQEVYDTYGVCHLLFNNAGVGGGGVGQAVELDAQRLDVVLRRQPVRRRPLRRVVRAAHDRGWRGRLGGEHVVGGRGFQPLPDLGVYAASKAAVSTYTECLANAFINEGSRLRAAVFYPGGNGLLETRLWNSGRNRPADLQREHPHLDQQWDYQEHKQQMEEAGVPVADLVELGRSVLQGLHDGKFIIQLDVESSGELMAQRRDGRGELPTINTAAAFE